MAVTHVVVEWGGLFPWTLDERFQSRLAYTEDILTGLQKSAGELGVSLIPRLPAGGNMSCFLAHPAYRHLRRKSDPDVIEPTAPGAAKFVSDLLEDIFSLLPTTEGVFFDPEPGRNVPGEYTDLVVANLLPTICNEAVRSDLRIFVPGRIRLSAFAAIDKELVDSIVALSPKTALPSSPELPPSAELVLDTLAASFHAADGALPEPDLEESRALRERFGAFCQSLNVCWSLIRATKQMLLTSTSLGHCIAMVTHKAGRLVGEIEREIGGSTILAKELDGELSPSVSGGAVALWLGSRIEPVKEEHAALENRVRQLEMWMESE